MMADTTAEPFDEFCVVELLGHRRLAARVREVTLAGAGMLRLDIPATDGHQAQTQYVSPSSVYALHPTTEAIVTAAAARFRPEPVSRWELRTIEPAPATAGRSTVTVDPDWDGTAGDEGPDGDEQEGGPF